MSTNNEQENKITKLETCYQFMTEKLENIEKMVVAFDAKLDKALEKKADKWVEKFLVGFVIFILTGLCSWIGTLIYKATIHIG